MIGISADFSAIFRSWCSVIYGDISLLSVMLYSLVMYVRLLSAMLLSLGMCFSFLLSCDLLWCVLPICYAIVYSDVSLLSIILWSLVMCHFFLLSYDLSWCVTSFCYAMISGDVHVSPFCYAMISGDVYVSPFCYAMISGDVSLLSAIPWSLVMCHFFLLCHDLWWCVFVFCYAMIFA